MRWKSWRPQHPYYKSHLRGRVPSCGRRHARFLQLLFQSGSGAYPFVKLLDGRLLLHTAYIHARQFAFAVAAHDKRCLYTIFICLFQVGYFTVILIMVGDIQIVIFSGISNYIGRYIILYHRLFFFLQPFCNATPNRQQAHFNSFWESLSKLSRIPGIE